MGQSILFIIALLWTGVVHAQVANMPKHVQEGVIKSAGLVRNVVICCDMTYALK
jgi:hypothetical protein